MTPSEQDLSDGENKYMNIAKGAVSQVLAVGRIHYGRIVAVRSDDSLRAQLPVPQLRYWIFWPVRNCARTWTMRRGSVNNSS